MPARDGTGPKGQGAGTGRGLGNCQPDAKLVWANRKRVWWNPLSWFGGLPRTGAGIRRGIGRGSGRGNRGQ